MSDQPYEPEVEEPDPDISEIEVAPFPYEDGDAEDTGEEAV
jgi:hypothetical protein